MNAQAMTTKRDSSGDALLFLAVVVFAGYCIARAFAPEPTYAANVHARCIAAGGTPVDVTDRSGAVLAVRCDGVRP